MAAADRAWLEGALVAWPATRSEVLSLAPAPMPEITVYDARCAYVARDGSAAELIATRHAGGKVVIGGHVLPLGPYAAADADNRFTISLPSVWRGAGADSPLGLERMMTGVFLHEVTHTTQSALLTAFKRKIERLSPGSSQLSDNTIQDLYGNDPGYRAIYERERDLLYEAARAPADEAARALVVQAIALMDARRSRFFTGDRAYLTLLDDVFLTMEGLGQYVMYLHYLEHTDEGYTPADALDDIRNSGKMWSQDHGFALMQVVARLVPDWRSRVFDGNRWHARDLLMAAVQRSGRDSG